MEITPKQNDLLKKAGELLKKEMSELVFENEEYRLYRLAKDSNLHSATSECFVDVWIAALPSIDIEDQIIPDEYYDELLDGFPDGGYKLKKLTKNFDYSLLFQYDDPSSGSEIDINLMRLGAATFVYIRFFENSCPDVVLVEKKTEHPDYVEVLSQMFKKVHRSDSFPADMFHINKKHCSLEKLLETWPNIPQEDIYFIDEN